MTRDRHLTPSSGSSSLRANRRFNRRVVDLEAEISPVNIKLNVPENIRTLKGRIRNVSPSGLFVELDSLYHVGTRFQVRIPIKGSIRTLYVIVWRVDLAQSEVEPAVFGHGMKITTAGDDTLNALVEFVNDQADRAEAAVNS